MKAVLCSKCGEPNLYNVGECQRCHHTLSECGLIVDAWIFPRGMSFHIIRNISELLSIAFSPDGAILASGSMDNTVRLWRASDGTLLRTLNGHKSFVRDVLYSPDGTQLISASDDGTIKIWGASEGDLIHTLEAKKRGVNSLAFSPDGTLLASCSEDVLMLWQLADRSLLRIMEGHTGWIYKVAFLTDNMLASASFDGTVKLWCASDGEKIGALDVPAKLNTLAFTPDGTQLAASIDDWHGCDIKLWGFSERWPVRTLVSDIDRISSMAFSPDGTLLASGSGKTITLWRVSDGKMLHTLEVHAEGVSCLAFSPNGSLLASSADCKIQFFGGVLPDIRCSICGKEHLDGTPYCMIHGQAFPKMIACYHCGEPVEEASDTCPICGLSTKATLEEQKTHEDEESKQRYRKKVLSGQFIKQFEGLTRSYRNYRSGKSQDIHECKIGWAYSAWAVPELIDQMRIIVEKRKKKISNYPDVDDFLPSSWTGKEQNLEFRADTFLDLYKEAVKILGERENIGSHMDPIEMKIREAREKIRREKSEKSRVSVYFKWVKNVIRKFSGKSR